MKKKYMFIVIFLISIFFIMPNVGKADVVELCSYEGEAVRYNTIFYPVGSYFVQGKSANATTYIKIYYNTDTEKWKIGAYVSYYTSINMYETIKETNWNDFSYTFSTSGVDVYTIGSSESMLKIFSCPSYAYINNLSYRPYKFCFSSSSNEDGCESAMDDTSVFGLSLTSSENISDTIDDNTIDEFYDAVYSSLELTLEGWICSTKKVNHTYTNFSNNYSTQIDNAMSMAAYSVFGVGTFSKLSSYIQDALNAQKETKINEMVNETKTDYESGKITCPTDLDDTDDTDTDDTDDTDTDDVDDTSASNNSNNNSSSSSSSNSNGSSFKVTYSNSSSPSCEDLTLYANSSNELVSKDLVEIYYSKDGSACGSDDYVDTNSSAADSTSCRKYTITEDEYIFYSAKSTSSTPYIAYCYNPGYSAGFATDGNAGTWVQLKCNRKLMSSSSAEMDILDTGIIAIIENGTDYWATETALRMYVYYFKNLNSNEDKLGYTGQSSHLKAWTLTFAKLAYNNYNSFSTELSGLSSYASVMSKSDLNTKYAGFSSSIWNTLVVPSFEADARNLVLIGLNAALTYADGNGTSSSNNSDSSESDEDVSLIIDEPRYNNYTDTEGNYVSEITYSFDYSGYSEGDELTLDFNCDNCSTNNVSYTLTAVIEGVEEELNSNTYTLTIDDTNTSGTVEFIIEFTASSSYKCSKKINYSIDVTHPTDGSGIAVYDVSVGDNTQHFYVYVENATSDSDEPSTDQITDSVSICDMTCEELKTACDDGNGDADACTTFNDTYGGTCTECTTYFSEATCSADSTELVIKEGTEGSTDSCDITDDLNVLECVIEQTDLTEDNEYKVTSGDGYTNVIDNPYCSVYCREEYHITLPGIQELNSGRYFTLSVTMYGEKDCYTSEITNYEEFEEELDDMLDEIYEAYDRWSMYKALTNLSVSETGNDTAETESGTFDCASSYYPRYLGYGNDSSGNTIYYYYIFLRDSNYNSLGYISATSYSLYSNYSLPEGYSFQDNYICSNYGFSTKVKYNIYNVAKAGIQYLNHNGTHSTITSSDISDVFGTGHIDCGTFSCTPVQDSTPKNHYENYYKDKYKSEMDKAANDLNKLISEFLEAVNDYNSCSGISVYQYDLTDYTIEETPGKSDGWNMTYNFDPIISFWYDETSYMNSAIETSTQLSISTYGTATTDDSATQTYFTCSSITDDYNECDATDGEQGTGAVNNYDEYKPKLCYATDDGYECKEHKIYISKATYVKQVMNSDATYITPTQFYTIYSSGAIVVAAEGTDIDNATVLENGLPVGLGTVSGVYNYALQVSNLGEYYDGNPNLGRIWGAETSVVTAAIDKYEVCYADSFALTDTGLTTGTTLDITNGVYVCAYKVSCPDCPVECDPICDWTYCPNNGCEVECDNCIYTIDTNVSYRPITTSDTNPNDRYLGINWNYGGTDINSITSVSTALELKAYVTTREIYEDGESIYNVVDGVNATAEYAINNDVSVTVTMDSSMISWIKEYNTDAGDYFTSRDGTSSTLECYDYESDSSGTQENIFCYSTFLDELIEEYPDQVDISVERPTGNARNATNAGVGSYWTTWDYASWDITTTNPSLSYYKSYNSEIGIGPSWK